MIQLTREEWMLVYHLLNTSNVNGEANMRTVLALIAKVKIQIDALPAPAPLPIDGTPPPQAPTPALKAKHNHGKKAE